MESQVEEIKKKLDIVDVIGKYLPLKKRGRHYLANCPFHSEKTPSFTVSQELQIYKCFGCGKAGDMFNFIEEYEHVDFKDALEDLAKMAGIKLVKSAEMSQVESRNRRLVDLNFELAKFYNFILTTHPLGKSALDYVLNRGITRDSVKTFRIGYSPVNTALAVNYLIKKGFTRQELIASGTFGLSRYHQNQFYDRFQDRLVFPLCDFRDRVLGFSGRILPASTSTNQAKYINSPETDIYHKSHMLFGLNLAKEAIKKANSVIIVEGEFDMISPYQHGVTNIVAIKGTAFTSDQLILLHRYTDTLILGLDSDFAGTSAARKSIELADSMEFDIQVLDLGEKYKDPDEAVTADPDFFLNRLNHTIPIWDFIIATALKNYDPTTVKGKKDILSMVLPFLVKINNSVTQSDYYHKLSQQIGSEVAAVIDEAAKLQHPPSPTSSPAATPAAPVSPRIDSLEEHLLTLIFSAKKPVDLSLKIKEKLDFTIPRFQKIFTALTSFDSDFAPQSFAASLPPEIVSQFQNIYLNATRFNFDPHVRVVEINKTVNQILSIQIKEQLVDVSARLARAENSGADEIVKTLELEYNQLLSKLSHVQSTKR